MDTNLLHLQDLGPAFGQYLLDVGPWRKEGRRRAESVCDSQLCRHPDAPDFARWSFRNLIDNKHLARDLKVGKAPDSELTNFFRRCRYIWPQDHRRSDVFTQRV